MTPEETTAAQDITTNILNVDVSGFLLKILGALVAIVIMILLGKVVAAIVKARILKHSDSESEHIQKVAALISSVVFSTSIIFAFFIGFEIIGFNVAIILWGISFWVWLAFKEILGNMIAGIMILYTKELKLWDVIEIDSAQQYFWRIEEITVRYTVIRTLDMRQIVIPNMTLISVPIRTFSAESIVKLTTKVWVHYDSDISKVIDVIKTTINQQDFVVEKVNTKVFVTNFGDSSIDLTAIFFFNPNGNLLWDYAVGYVNEAIDKAFKENNITIPYPHVTLTYDSPTQKKQVIQWATYIDPSIS